jgi:hypothetical protein
MLAGLHPRPPSMTRPQEASMHAQIRTVRLARPRLDHGTLARGGLVIAVVDFLFCLAFWSPLGAGPGHLLRSVAAGLLGPAAFAGGWPAAALGAACMWLIGCAFVLTYAWAATRLAGLRLHALRLGPAYGMLLYVVMLRVVVPLSAAPEPARAQLAWAVACLPMFAVFGMLAAFFGTRCLPPAR